MPLTTAQQVRLRIQDQPSVFDAAYVGNGLLDTFPLPYLNMTSATAFVQGAAAWSPTGATFTNGTVAFSSVISANSAFRVRGVQSTFSDDEIDTMLTAGGGSVLGASVEAVQTLMFDALKRASWAAPDGTQYDDTAAQRALRDLYDVLKEEEHEDAATAGGFASWSLNQGDT